MKKNKHADMICIWALTGQPVQRLVANEFWGGFWVDDNYPAWLEQFEYRFKPETVQSRRYIFRIDGETQVATVMDDETAAWAEDSELFVKWIDETWQTHTV